MKTSEEIIREELRALTGKMMDVYKWGVSLLATMQTAFFFLRKDVYQRMLDNHELAPGTYLPWNRYLIGTGVLLVVSLIFVGFSHFLRLRFYFYVKLLNDKSICENPVPLPPTPWWIGWILTTLYFTFPIMDIVIRIVLGIEMSLK